VPKLLRASQPEDAEEERKVRKLAGSRHAPGDWIFRARIISCSWRGLRTTKIAEELGCHPKTVRERIHRFNAEGIDGLGDRLRTGRRPRLTQPQRSKIIALVAKNPPASSLPSLTAYLVPRTRPRRPTGRWTRSPRVHGR
jgi:transposase